MCCSGVHTSLILFSETTSIRVIDDDKEDRPILLLLLLLLLSLLLVLLLLLLFLNTIIETFRSIQTTPVRTTPIDDFAFSLFLSSFCAPF